MVGYREDLVSHLFDSEIHKICLLGVTEAYLFYMQREMVRFHQEVQTVNSRTDWPGGETANTEGCLV